MPEMKYLIILLFLVSSAYGADTTQYIQQGASCVGDDGSVGNPWCDCASFAAQNLDLVTATNNMTVISTGTFTTGSCAITSSWTTSSSYKINFQGLKLVSDNYGVVFSVDGEFVTCTQCTIAKTAATTSRNLINISSTANIVLDKSLIYYGPSWTSDGGTYGVGIGGSALVRNTMFYNIKHSGVAVGLNSSKTYQFLNNTIAGTENEGLNIFVDGGSTGTVIDIKNNLITGCGTTCYTVTPGSATLTTATNATSDATSPQVSLRSLTISYVSATDPHLDPAETDVDNEGTDLTAAHGFSVDYDGDARGTSWSIGADQLAAAPTPTPTPTITARKGQKCSAAVKGQCIQ